MPVTHIEHKLDVGILSIDADIDNGFRFQFKYNVTDTWFDAKYNYNELCKICPIFFESQELFATLNVEPKILIKDPEHFDVIFSVAGRNTTYPAHIQLTSRTFIEVEQKIADLDKTIADLKGVVSKQSDDISKLANLLLRECAQHDSLEKCVDLAPLLKRIESPIKIKSRFDARSLTILTELLKITQSDYFVNAYDQSIMYDLLDIIDQPGVKEFASELAQKLGIDSAETHDNGPIILKLNSLITREQKVLAGLSSGAKNWDNDTYINCNIKLNALREVHAEFEQFNASLFSHYGDY